MLSACQTCVCLFVLHLMIIPWPTVSGFQCYNCTSRETPTCGDPFDGSRVEKIDCKTSCYKRRSTSQVTRGCSRTVAYKFSDEFECVRDVQPIRGVEMECICNEMECNSSPSSRDRPTDLILFMTTIFVSKYILQ